MYGKIIKQLRYEKKLTQAQLGEIIGATQKSISRYEKEEIELNFNQLIKIADYFSCSIDYLLGRENDFGIIESKNNLTLDENELLTIYRKLDVRKQNKVLGYVQALAY